MNVLTSYRCRDCQGCGTIKYMCPSCHALCPHGGQSALQTPMLQISLALGAACVNQAKEVGMVVLASSVQELGDLASRPRRHAWGHMA